MKKNISFQQLGISLLEVLLSLSIIAIILVMATKYFFLASDSDRVNVLRQEIGEVVAAIRNWKGQNPEYTSGLSYQKLYDDGFLAKSKFLANGEVSGGGLQLFGPWGQPIKLASNTDGVVISVQIPTNAECQMLLNSYPDGACDNGANTGPAVFTLKEV